MSRLNVIKENKGLLLTGEVIGWIHMLGKVHPDFLREHCADIPDDQKPSYDYEEFYKQDSELKKLAEDKAFQKVLKGSKPFDSPGAKLAAFFKRHRKKDGSGLLYLLQEAHGIVSGVEKNLPKKTSEYLRQTSDNMWLTNAFGHDLQNLVIDTPESFTSGGCQQLYETVVQLLKTILKDHRNIDVESWFQLRLQTIEKCPRYEIGCPSM